MGNDFVEYLTSLAEEGETLLLVRQTVKDDKVTYPSFLPDHRRKEGESWYGNTGAFVVSRFDKRPAAKADNCDFVLVMMLDDVGTKSKPAPLAPTWVMETSPGNYQWGYVFSEQPTKGAFSAAIKAIADAGYTDPGAVNPVRNFRLPGSVNIKNGFVSRLVELHPGREYTLEQVCEALDVTPGPPEEHGKPPIRLADTGQDSVVDWLNEHGLVLQGANPEGWLGIVCPNAGEHTDGLQEARYLPASRAFRCFHGHCDHLDSAAFLSWVEREGGPRVLPGLRDDLIAGVMKGALERLEPTPDYPDDAVARVAEVEARQLGRIQKSDWFKRFAYVQNEDGYFDLVERTILSRQAFNALFRHVTCHSIHGKQNRRIEASNCFDETRQAAGGHAMAGITYAVGHDVILEREGQVYGNTWRDARVRPVGAGGDVSLWLDHCKRMVPDREQREHCLDVMAFKLQNPAVKVNHAILHVGPEGCGKDSMWAPFLQAVGGPYRRNTYTVSEVELKSQWGYWYESEVSVLNELYEAEARDRRALADKLKPIIAAPPELLPINKKNMHPYQMLNRVLVLAFSNHPVPILLPSEDRRWFCIKTEAGRWDREDPEGPARLWDWYERGGGFDACASWLYARDVSKFNPKASAPDTDFKQSVVEQGRSSVESALVEMIAQGRGEFALGAAVAPFQGLIDRLEGQMANGGRIHMNALLRAFSEAGWIDLGRAHSRRFTQRRQMYASRKIADTMSKSEIIDMLEGAPVEGNVIPMKSPASGGG